MCRNLNTCCASVPQEAWLSVVREWWSILREVNPNTSVILRGYKSKTAPSCCSSLAYLVQLISQGVSNSQPVGHLWARVYSQSSPGDPAAGGGRVSEFIPQAHSSALASFWRVCLGKSVSLDSKLGILQTNWSLSISVICTRLVLNSTFQWSLNYSGLVFMVLASSYLIGLHPLISVSSLSW